MINHRELIKEITRELYEDDNALALILYGSFSRHEESANSDIDLMVITNEYHLQKRHAIRCGITVEFLEIHLDFLHNFIVEREIPILFSLADGIVLFDKISTTKQLKDEARKILDEGPPVNTNWENERYKVKKRSDLTEIYSDLLDVNDEISFNYITSLFISNVITLLLENNKLWPTTRKKTMNYLKSQCYDGYQFIETLLSPRCSLSEKRSAAKNLIEYVLKPHGGILEGDAIIFKKNSI